MITILISTEEYDLVSLRSTVRRRVKRFGGKPVKVMGRGGGGGGAGGGGGGGGGGEG